MVNQYYVYCVDRDFGPFFMKFSSYFPYNAKLYLLTELRRGSAGQADVGRLRVYRPARDRIRRGPGPGGAGGPSGGSVAGDGSSVRAVSAG